MLPESAFVSLTRLQSNGLLQSGLGIDSSIYHNVIGLAMPVFMILSIMLAIFLVCTLSILQGGAILYRSTCFYIMKKK